MTSRKNHVRSSFDVSAVNYFLGKLGECFETARLSFLETLLKGHVDWLARAQDLANVNT